MSDCTSCGGNNNPQFNNSPRPQFNNGPPFNNQSGHGHCCDGNCNSVQPDKIRLVRNVNATCYSDRPCGTPRSCTRCQWLRGIDCCGDGTDLSDSEVVVEQGGVARLCVEFNDGTGQPSDPSDPRITIKDPFNHIYLSSSPMQRVELGKWVFLFGTDGTTRTGKWTAEVIGTIFTNGVGVAVTSTFFFGIVRIGSLPYRHHHDGYGHEGYGYGDCYGDHCGACETYGFCDHGLYSGADGYGTFAGREECGFDGCKSKDIPATGGCRTNRNPIGDGFWDGISYESSCITPIGKRGQCMKDRAVAMTRVKLKDIEARCWAFGEDEVDMLLEASLSDFNATPTFTYFTWDTLPEIYLGVVAMGAQVSALIAQGILEAGREFTITDNGISFTPPQISGYIQSAYSTLLASYTEWRDKIKGNIKPTPAGTGTFRVLSLLPTLSRLRHLRAKQII